ncbi:type II toxin-antitoxin system MqsA family antitoxin [Granulicella tundricola]|uniref:Helix-turn-helix domain protein n=1 Tax=Granulicella tundricola (strain ATCC BAA-1859 / DSM 23138 / MP5ACTX9) TaxID=1198114 RepID=E8X0E7_GRATM|nr:type II toxin-antitoxin system MqsA family antitoxin [Granulicella tundricola]ADW67811.1 helix-turn-helix domain protein [Granulicella tundricola MP5ACTX9]
MKCPNCGDAKLVRGVREMPYSYKGESTVLGEIAGSFCAACGETVLDAPEANRVSALMLEFNKQVNASMVDPEFISRVRKKLALDQREASVIFGGGVNAFSRYENGKTKPPVALIKLLKVLERHPDLLAEVKTA